MVLVSMTAVEQRSVTVKCVALRRTESKKKTSRMVCMYCVFIYIYIYVCTVSAISAYIGESKKETNG